ncbi:MAG: helix-turn-helix transcriptional regulator [Desulfobacterales bacterium]|nr:MAG: helix-turn-helix transcriptional regulator [Desulfobacterales bacterium]
MTVKNQKPSIDIDFFEDLTGEIPVETPPGAEDIGQRIRKIREAKGMSLESISQMTGFEVDFLDGIEKNEIQPQLGTVIKLSKALDSAFGRLVSGVGDRLYSITRKNERRTIQRSTSQKGQTHLYTYKSLAPDVKGRHMEALIVQLEESPAKEISVHAGEEFIYVLQGAVVLEIGEDKYELEPGDSAYYLSTTPHHIAAKTGQAAILAVLYEG